MAESPAELEKQLRNASRWGFALGAGFLALGLLWLDQYLSTGGVYFSQEERWLAGQGALTALLGSLAGGVVLVGFGIYYRLQLRARRRQSSPWKCE